MQPSGGDEGAAFITVLISAQEGVYDLAQLLRKLGGVGEHLAVETEFAAAQKAVIAGGIKVRFSLKIGKFILVGGVAEGTEAGRSCRTRCSRNLCVLRLSERAGGSLPGWGRHPCRFLHLKQAVGGTVFFHRPGPLRLLHIVGVGEHLAAELCQLAAVHLLRDAHGNEGGQLGEILVAAAFQQIGGQGHRLYAAGEAHR